MSREQLKATKSFHVSVMGGPKMEAQKCNTADGYATRILNQMSQLMSDQAYLCGRLNELESKLLGSRPEPGEDEPDRNPPEIVEAAVRPFIYELGDKLAVAQAQVAEATETTHHMLHQLFTAE